MAAEGTVMSSYKRRKLDVSPTKPRLSAFAARQALKSNTSSPKSPAKKDESATGSEAAKSTDLNDPVLDAPVTLDPQNPIGNTTYQDATSSYITANHKLDEEPQLASFESRGGSSGLLLQRPAVSLSSFKPGKSNVKCLGVGAIRVKVAPGERLVIVGQYELCIQGGQVTLLGATLQPSKTSYRVFSASSHSLPVLRCVSTDVSSADIVLRNCSSGLEDLETLSPLFGKLWSPHAGPFGAEYEDSMLKIQNCTFKILFSSKLDLQSNYLQPLVSPPEWNLLLSRLSKPTETKCIVMVCGPKSSGKSTFTKLLCNRLLSGIRGMADASQGIALLDLDPGQPEYSPPGQLALVHVQVPNFGPPFSHPIPPEKSKIIRAHSIASISPSSDPGLYMACALDLLSHYRATGSAVRDCPLIINTPGWVFGTGLEILVDLIHRVKPTEVIYMSQDGPPEVVDTLREAIHSKQLLTVPSQTSEYTTRTAAHLRTMQAMSYFHLITRNTGSLNWSGTPLTSIPPWEVRYSGEDPGILGVMCYGEQPPPELLVDTITGSLVAVVVIDDMFAILGRDNGQQEGYVGCPAQEGNFDAEIRVLDHSNEPPRIEKPLILPTPAEQIPYFNPANAITLDPRYSHSIGIALVRGIDVRRRRIQLLSPVSPSIIDEINASGKTIVLVSGKLDTPGWAYTEELNMTIALEKTAEKLPLKIALAGEADMDLDNADVDDDLDDDYLEEGDVQTIEGRDSQRAAGDRFRDAPWVERLDGSKGRGVGARVWRVRRDLGRLGDGGE
ncbi:Polynucleotide 5'-hydroxyl-kinase grc3 [Cadophora gregata]|uniref:Polynucleotide 5'-hydroxyl-kinase grc3 n=1 Tax=Cadophora gregata TaxID=51156 RepID=UPI0026DB7F11|nr:Polynucleotide 5'-hydroxyl-kinase grc3 [Cadophora gregata]KAK0113720.1 Polynucleotide 5'-hydroxyl-kinase grc3 [Cadophora gregata f. sp. sojae]KAK0114477.1 Polynucleotide 5'-hydroxyl-kinase grc3 [Cadophora gregata]